MTSDSSDSCNQLHPNQKLVGFDICLKKEQVGS